LFQEISKVLWNCKKVKATQLFSLPFPGFGTHSFISSVKISSNTHRSCRLCKLTTVSGIVEWMGGNWEKFLVFLQMRLPWSYGWWAECTTDDRLKHKCECSNLIWLDQHWAPETIAANKVVVFGLRAAHRCSCSHLPGWKEIHMSVATWGELCREGFHPHIPKSSQEMSTASLTVLTQWCTCTKGRCQIYASNLF